MKLKNSSKGRTSGESTPLGSGDRFLFWRFVLPLVFAPYLLLGAAYFVIPTQWFLDRSNSTYLENLGYGATVHNADCRVLIYGDSTAMVGLNPALMKARTGLTTCNIAEFAGMTIVNGNAVLDVYLRQNQRPRYLIFLFAPEDMDPQSQRQRVPTFEAITWRLLQPNKLLSFVTLFRHPDELLVWADMGLTIAYKGRNEPPFTSEAKAIRRQRDGWFPMQGYPMKGCVQMPGVSTPNDAWMKRLRSEYGVDGTTVILDSMPMPSCDSRVNYFKQELAGKIDNSVETLPASVFIDAHHVDEEGATMLSNLIADQIARRMSADALTGGR